MLIRQTQPHPSVKPLSGDFASPGVDGYAAAMVAPQADPAGFVLLDDARGAGTPGRLYRDPAQTIVARRPEEVQPALEKLATLHRAGHHLAGYFAYEAGLALEPRLLPQLDARWGAAGPLLWFGAFAACETIPDVPGWLAAAGGAAGGHGAGRLGPLNPALGPGAYATRFAAIRAAILAGEIYQANLTFPLRGRWRGEPLALYAALRGAGGGGHGGVVFDGEAHLLSLSPESFFALDDAGRVTARPMKGTRPRGQDARRDAALAHELAMSEKDRAENLMIVDLMRNDLARIAVPGSVRVTQAFAIEAYPAVHQMVSTVSARLAADKGALDCLAALLPAGSVTGAPKIRAIELLGAAEPTARGPYCGAIGRIDPPGPEGATQSRGGAAFNVAIRTLRLTPEPGGAAGGDALLGVGSAVVADSCHLGEWRECLVKGGFVVASPAAGFDLIEAMRFTPDDGIALLELHLARLSASAAALGFAFDRHQARNRIQALCFDLGAAAKLRLLLARDGAIALEAAPLALAPQGPIACAVLPLPIDPGDIRLRHKTSERGFYEAARRIAVAAGAAEALLLRDDGQVTEGSRTNIFVAREGTLLTPPAGLGLLPGVLRRSLLDAGEAREAALTLADLAGGFLLGNAVHGLMPARLLA